MLKFTIQNQKYEMLFEGYKIIQSPNPDWLLKQLMVCLDNEGISIDNRTYKTKNSLIVHNWTKTSDLFNFTKANYLTQILSEEILNQDEALSAIYNQILDKINTIMGFEYLDINMDLTKTINAHFDFNEDQYLDLEQLYRYLAIPSSSKQLLIVCDFQGIQLSQLSKYLNYFNILIITNDCFNYLSYGKQLESVCIINDQDYIDIMDYEQLNAAIESFINEPINDRDWELMKQHEYSVKLAKIEYCFNNIMFKKDNE